MTGGTGVALPQEQPHVPKTRSRHQLQRSISEIASPARLSRHPHRHHHTTHDTHHRGTHGSFRHKRHGSRDDHNMSVPQSAAPILQVPPRGSLEVPRSEGITPRNASPTPSPRGSLFFITPSSEAAGGASAITSAESRDEALRRERERAEAGTACVSTTCLWHKSCKTRVTDCHVPLQWP